MLYGCNQENKSLNQCAIEVKNRHKVSISKQGLDERFNAQSVLFIKSLLEEQVKLQITSQVSSDLLNKFNRVLIKDSTRFDIAEQHKEVYPGSRGSASKASMCIQFEFDVKDGKISDLNLTPAIRQDCTDAVETQDEIAKDDLAIRDMGYFALDVFERIIEKGAFFISRLEPKVLIFEHKNDSFVQLSYKGLYRQMRQSRQSTIDIDVFIGKTKKLPVRLIVQLIPKEIYNERMRKIHRKNQKKGYTTSDEYKEYARFNFYITNIPIKEITSTEIIQMYRIRWQIELVFKVWKSIFEIDKIGKMKLYRFLSLLYVKLLWIFINWEIVMNLKPVFQRVFRKTLSMYKSFMTIKENFEILRKELLKRKVRGYVIVNWMIEILSEKHWLEKRKNRIGYEEILFKHL